MAKYQHLGKVAQCLPWCPLVSSEHGPCLHRHWAEPASGGLGSGDLMGEAGVRETRAHVSDLSVTSVCSRESGLTFPIP